MIYPVTYAHAPQPNGLQVHLLKHQGCCHVVDRTTVILFYAVITTFRTCVELSTLASSAHCASSPLPASTPPPRSGHIHLFTLTNDIFSFFEILRIAFSNQKMRTSIPRLAVSAALAGSASAMIVTSGSSCSVQCGNSLDATAPSEIVCSQSSMAGSVLETCMNCELTSTAYTTNPNQTDQQWLLYNSRYAISECLWGYPGNTSVSDSPCITS